MQGKVMPQVHKLNAAIHGEVERTAGALIQADEADLSNVNQGTIHPTQATTKAVEFMDKTGWAPDPQSSANQLSTELNNAAGMKFKDAKLLRSRIGAAEAAAYRRGDNLAGGYLTAMRSGLSDAMASRAQDLGMSKAWDHYNNEANAMFDLQRNNLFGDLLESRPGPDSAYRVLNGEDRLMPLVKRLAAKVETKGPTTTFSGDLSQARDWMQKYGLNVKDWDASLNHARSLSEAHERLQKGFGQGLYRMALNHPEHALLPLGVYAAMHGAGIYGFAPFLAASAVGSMSATGSSLAAAGRAIRSIREGVPASAYQTMTNAEGQASEYLQRQATGQAVQQMQQGKGVFGADGIAERVKSALASKGLPPDTIETAVRETRGQHNNFNDALRAAMAVATKAAIENKKAGR